MKCVGRVDKKNIYTWGNTSFPVVLLIVELPQRLFADGTGDFDVILQLSRFSRCRRCCSASVNPLLALMFLPDVGDERLLVFRLERATEISITSEDIEAALAVLLVEMVV